MSNETTPFILGLFEKRIEGDDALLELARLRFDQGRMGAEVHTGSLEQFERLLRLTPSNETRVIIHLPRDFRLTHDHCGKRALELAAGSAGRVRGLVVHDHEEMARHPEPYVMCAQQLNDGLLKLPNSPTVFIEYAAGLEPRRFIHFFSLIRDLSHVSACLDIGHVGIRHAQRAYAALHSGQDICALKNSTGLTRQDVLEIESILSTAVTPVLSMIEALGSLEKPIHFHLHDGHPLSRFSPFGVSDHLSFLSEIPLPSTNGRRQFVPAMFGLEGLSRIVRKAAQCFPIKKLSFTLEIHPIFEREPLGDAAHLFNHWCDKTNAEQMNHWLVVLDQNRKALAEALRG